MFNKYSTQRIRVAEMLSKVLVLGGFLIFSPVNALEVKSGAFIQTMDTEALQNSSSLSLNDFFQGEASLSRFFSDFENREETAIGPPPLLTNQFIYPINSPEFISPEHRTIPSTTFSFDPNDVTGTAKGAIGLDGVIRFELQDGRLFLLGDWAIEYDKSRKDHGGSGWYMRNVYQIPGVIFDILDENIIAGADSFYLSGNLGWSPEFTQGFSAVVPESELLTVISNFVLCAQDDNAFAANPAQQIPCVFPNIKANGQTGKVSVESIKNVALTVDLGLAMQKPIDKADYFVAAVHEGEVYWLNQNFQWTTVASPAYQGALINVSSFKIPSPTFDVPSGTEVPFYFGVDGNQNGVFDEPYRFTRVDIKIK